jgi:hypothetical protein
MERLLALPPATLAAIAARFQAANDDPHPTGIQALATWPDGIRALAARLYAARQYAAGIAAHRLPVYWRWLFDDLGQESDLTASPVTVEFARLSRAMLSGGGGGCLAHGGAYCSSFRRGGVAGLSHCGVPPRRESGRLSLCRRL